MVVRVFIVLLFLLSVYIANAFANPISQREVLISSRQPLYGVSYSFEQASWYGLDAKKAYTDLLDRTTFDWVRLPFFWDQMVSENGELKIENLKFAIEEAQKRNIKVIIALGAKTPYYPEYHWPNEILAKVKFGELITVDHPIAFDILEIDRKVVEQLSHYEIISYWQVENEPLVGNINRWKIDPSLVSAEVAVVRATDKRKRPIILNHAAVGFYDQSWKELLPILSERDVFAVNAFFKTKGVDLVTGRIFGHEIHIKWPDKLVWPVYSWGIFSPNLNSIKETVESNGNRFWILEMQAEPYIKNLEDSKDSFLTFKAQDIVSGNIFLRSYSVESIGLWGAHFWQYKESVGDKTWMEAAKKVTSD